MSQQPSRKRMGGKGERERLEDLRWVLERRAAKRKRAEGRVVREHQRKA
jgi:hypothetical protein